MLLASRTMNDHERRRTDADDEMIDDDRDEATTSYNTDATYGIVKQSTRY